MMCSRRKPGPDRPKPTQLPLFAEGACLVHLRPERGEGRFYRIEVWPDLLGRAILAQRWGRIGTKGSLWLEPYPEPGAAIKCSGACVRRQAAPGLSGSSGVSRRPVVKPNMPKATRPLAKNAKPKGKAGRAVSPAQLAKLPVIPPIRKARSAPKLPGDIPHAPFLPLRAGMRIGLIPYGWSDGFPRQMPPTVTMRTAGLKM